MPLSKAEISKMEAEHDVAGLIKAMHSKGGLFMSSDAAYTLHREAGDAIRRIANADSVDLLLPTLQEEDWTICSVGMDVFVGLKESRAVEPLIAMLRHPNIHRDAAARALGEIGDTRAVEPLVATLKESSESHVLEKVAQSLERLGWIPPKDEVGVKFWISRRNFDKCLEIGLPALEPLLSINKKYSHEDWKAARKSLLDHPKIEFLEPLIGILASKRDVDTRTTAAEVLGRIGDKRAVETLVKVLTERGDHRLREAAAQALDLIGDDRAVEPLIQAVQSVIKTSGQSLSDYLEALVPFKDTKAVKELKASLATYASTCNDRKARKALIKLGVIEKPSESKPENLPDRLSTCPKCATPLKSEEVGYVTGLFCPACHWAAIFCYSCQEGWMLARPYTIRPGVPLQARLKCEACSHEADADYEIINWFMRHKAPGF